MCIMRHLQPLLTRIHFYDTSDLQPRTDADLDNLSADHPSVVAVFEMTCGI